MLWRNERSTDAASKIDAVFCFANRHLLFCPCQLQLSVVVRMKSRESLIAARKATFHDLLVCNALSTDPKGEFSWSGQTAGVCWSRRAESNGPLLSNCLQNVEHSLPAWHVRLFLLLACQKFIPALLRFHKHSKSITACALASHEKSNFWLSAVCCVAWSTPCGRKHPLSWRCVCVAWHLCVLSRCVVNVSWVKGVGELPKCSS